jgi:hypothetical protein
MKQRTIEKWSLCFTNDSPYIAPEMRLVCFQGTSYNHPTINDGDWIRTSGIVKYDEVLDLFTTETGSVYKLGEIDPQYAKLYPEALAGIKIKLS